MIRSIGPTTEELLRDPHTGPATRKLLEELIEGLEPEVREPIEKMMRDNPPSRR